MTERKGSGTLALLGAAAIVAVGAVAIYLSGAGNGNRDDGILDSQITLADANCAAATERAAALDALAIGQMAGLRFTDRPIYLGGLSFARADGAPVTLADLAGPAILVNLWATWCPPCRAEMPGLDALAAETADEPFRVIALNTLETAPPGRPAEFLAEIGVRTMPLFLDPESRTFYELRRRSLAVGLPTTLLVDETGCLLAVMEGPAEWASPEALAVVAAVLAE